MRLVNMLSGALTATIVFTTGVIANDYMEKAKTEIECLALNIYHEARGESVTGQIAVGNVTMNRVSHPKFPNTVCDVVWQSGQFSWTNDGRSDTPTQQREWVIAQKIASDVYFSNQREDVAPSALFYHATHITPYWVSHMKPIDRIGQHQFYVWNGKW